MKCRYLDERADFFPLLNEKLGGGFELQPGNLEESSNLAESDALLATLPSLDHPRFGAALAQLQRIVRTVPSVPVIAFLSTSDREAMRRAMEAGAYDHFVETGPLEELRLVLRRAAQFHDLYREVRRLRDAGVNTAEFSELMGLDSEMAAILTLASRVASTDATVLLRGETGTGKELLARSIHRASLRSRQPFVAVACCSLPETLIEAELFGHEKGAFTGAAGARAGRFEAAENGTIFLDEIGELSPTLQVRLLRVLQERTFERLGSNLSRPMKARVICATNRNLEEMTRSGAFRLDLYYRLNTVEIELPPLRQRREDISLLAQQFLSTYAQRHQRPVNRIAPSVLMLLEEYDWPGNVRELQNVIERAVVICEGSEIRLEHMPGSLRRCLPEEPGGSLDDEVRNFKRRLISRTLAEYGNNKVQAARSLKIARSSLHRLIDDLHISSGNGEGLVH